jgi:hypothetical protein
MIGCAQCSKMHSLGIWLEGKNKLSMNWVNCTVTVPSDKTRENILSAYSKKIKKHVESNAHVTAGIALQDMPSNSNILKSVNDASAHQQLVTENIMRTAYYIAKKNRPYSDHLDLITLQKLNSCDVGITLHSRLTATNIISHISDEMKKKN